MIPVTRHSFRDAATSDDSMRRIPLTEQHPALITTVNSLISSDLPPSPSASDPYPTPSILVFTTHHRPHLAEADLAFFPLLAKSGGGWAYEQIVSEYAGPMFPEDPGEEIVRGTVKGWRCWRVGQGEVPGERASRVLRVEAL
jgi:nicotinamide N-methyltransferase